MAPNVAKYREPLTKKQVLLGCCFAILCLLLIWQLIVIIFKIPGYILPKPTSIIENLYEYREVLLANLLVTIKEALIGLCVSIFLGVSLAVIFQYETRFDQIGTPLIASLQSFPKEALAPLLVVWFGFGLTSKVVLACAIAFFPVFISTLRGLKSIPQDVIYTFIALRATNWQIMTKCRFRFALPFLFSGIRVASTLSIVGAVIGEFMGSSSGIGHLILSANSQFEVSLVFACLLSLGATGLVLDTFITAIEKRVIPWHESSSDVRRIV